MSRTVGRRTYTQAWPCGGQPKYDRKAACRQPVDWVVYWVRDSTGEQEFSLSCLHHIHTTMKQAEALAMAKDLRVRPAEDVAKHLREKGTTDA